MIGTTNTTAKNHFFTIIKITKSLLDRIFLRRLVHSGKAPDSVRTLLAGIQIGHRSSVLTQGQRLQHIVPDIGEGVVIASIFVQRRLPHPDVECPSNTLLEPSWFCC